MGWRGGQQCTGDVIIKTEGAHATARRKRRSRAGYRADRVRAGKGAWAATGKKAIGRDFVKTVTTEQSLGGGESQQMAGQECSNGGNGQCEDTELGHGHRGLGGGGTFSCCSDGTPEARMSGGCCSSSS